MNNNSEDYVDVSDPRKVPVFGVKYRKDNIPSPLRWGAILCLCSIFVWFFVDSKENSFKVLTISMLGCLTLTAVVCGFVLFQKRIPIVMLWLGGFSVIFSVILGITLVGSQIFKKENGPPFSLWATTMGSILLIGSVGYILMILREIQRKKWENLPADNFWRTPRFYGIPGGLNKDDNDITAHILAKQKSEIHTARILADFVLKNPGVFVFNNIRPFNTQHLRIDHLVVIGHNIFVIDSKSWTAGCNYEVMPGLALCDGEPFAEGTIKIFDKVEIIRKLINDPEINVQGFLSVDIEYGSIYCHPGSSVVVPLWELQQTLKASLTHEGMLSDWLVEKDEEKNHLLGSYIYEPIISSVLNLLERSTPEWTYETLSTFSTFSSKTEDKKSLEYRIEVPIRDDVKQWFLNLEGQEIFGLESNEKVSGCVTQIIKNINNIIQKWEDVRENILDQNIAVTLSSVYDVYSSNINNLLDLLASTVKDVPEGIPDIVVELYVEAYTVCRDLLDNFHELAENINSGVFSAEWFNSLDSVTLSLDAYTAWQERREEILSQVQELLNIND